MQLNKFDVNLKERMGQYMIETIIPLGNRIVAIQKKAETKSKSGLYLADSDKEAPVLADVISTGIAVQSVLVGDQIVYKEYAATDIKIDGIEYLIVSEEDVLATLKGEKNA